MFLRSSKKALKTAVNILLLLLQVLLKTKNIAKSLSVNVLNNPVQTANKKAIILGVENTNFQT
ncbi:MAG: hypothetical protein MUF58_11910 [Arcicella sp.]|jgi:hypothetical protein|nr:hypothetical protein [Arcicella sp.]